MQKRGVAMSFNEDLSDSANDFVNIVWPSINSKIDGGELIPAEQLFDMKFFNLVDMHSGIDAFQFSTQHGIRTLASRIQWGSTPWNTFTIRYKRASGTKTEYEKRIKAILGNEGWLYPYYTVHAYINKRYLFKTDDKITKKLLSVAIVKTKELYLRVYENVKSNEWDEVIYIRKNRQDGNEFLVVDWDEYKSEGWDIIIMKNGCEPHG